MFRGLIAGTLARILSVSLANIVQAIIFTLPHVGVLFVAPELWEMLIAVFVMALIFGRLRFKSGSILGPWLIHGAVNFAMALLVVTRTK